ncbi:hypothetical protein C2S51_021009 [Perilla frutescens var. frutescens]|nr:hypothetical protein C2S51_021009 [Perilla frutescens var. frutescens]
MAMFLLLLSVSLPIFIIIFLLATQYKSRRREIRHPPGPKGLPFIGNLHQVDISKPHIWFTKLSNKYGPLMLVKLCRVPLLVISSADVAKKALKHNDVAFAGRPCTFASSRLSYDHSDIITSSYTDYWKEMRKMVVHHLFSPQKIRSFRPVREDEVSSMIAGVSKKANNSNQLIDIREMISSFNCNVLCRIAFGKILDQGSWKQLEKIISQFVASLLESTFTDVFVFGIINKLSGAARRVEKVFEEMDSFYQQLIDEHLDQDRPHSMANDIVDLLIQLKEDKSAAVKLDSKHVKAIIMDVFIAGTDTTAASLTWAMTALIKNPNAMKKVQEEIRSLVGKERLIDEDDVENLPYLKAVVKEILRLYPSIPLIPKQTIEACIINGYNIEAKTFVFVNTWAIGRDPEYWENADEFLPDRFLNTSFDYKGRDLRFIPFGSGRRICPGASLAIANMEVALANLLYFFDWEIPNGKTEQDIDTDASMGIVLHKKNPLHLLAKTYV